MNEKQRNKIVNEMIDALSIHGITYREYELIIALLDMQIKHQFKI